MPKQTRLGADFQAELPLLTSPSVRPPPAPPPLCLCARPATWLRKRWWCADEERGCAFEVVPPPFERTPLCSCAEPALWMPRDERWRCATPRSAGGCDLDLAGLDLAPHAPAQVLPNPGPNPNPNPNPFNLTLTRTLTL